MSYLSDEQAEEIRSRIKEYIAVRYKLKKDFERLKKMSKDDRRSERLANEIIEVCKDI